MSEVLIDIDGIPYCVGFEHTKRDDETGAEEDFELVSIELCTSQDITMHLSDSVLDRIHDNLICGNFTQNG